MNPILEIPYDISDNEIISYYTSILRSLAFKMNKDNIFLFLKSVFYFFLVILAFTNTLFFSI